MKTKSLKYGESLHKEYPKTCDPQDFWGQVCRTVNGEPVGQEHVDMIVDQVRSSLAFSKNDSLLDIGCGNGALASIFFQEVGSYLGVDFSEYLVSVAKDNFEKSDFVFLEVEAEEFVRTYDSPERFNKALCYGAFSYFDDAMATAILSGLNQRFANLERVFIGNLPDRDRADDFYHSEERKQRYMDDPKSSLGFWRSEDQFVALCKACGWSCAITRMPAGYYAAHYRYDALLQRL